MSQYTLLEFQADWCGPCKTQEPIIDELNDEYDDIEVEKVDVDENRERANKYQVRSVPTMVVLGDDGEVETRFVGVTQKNEIVEELGL